MSRSLSQSALNWSSNATHTETSLWAQSRQRSFWSLVSVNTLRKPTKTLNSTPSATSSVMKAAVLLPAPSTPATATVLVLLPLFWSETASTATWLHLRTSPRPQISGPLVVYHSPPWWTSRWDTATPRLLSKSSSSTSKAAHSSIWRRTASPGLRKTTTNSLVLSSLLKLRIPQAEKSFINPAWACSSRLVRCELSLWYITINCLFYRVY